MICVFSPDNRNFDGNGDAVLMPTSGTMKQAAGGSYSLTMVHPIDPAGKWEYLEENAILRIPVPEEEIKNAFTGYEAWIYKAVGQVAIREDTEEPEAVTYTEWNSATDWEVGDKVTVTGRGNYQCLYYDDGSQVRFVPPYNSSWWKEISSSTSGAAALANVPDGTLLYWVSGDGDWWEVSTENGITGYCKSSDLEFYEHLTPEETKPRIITTQLFRIKKVTVDTAGNTVTVEAEHVSYDNGGNIVKEAQISQASPGMAIGKVISNLMMELRGSVATNLTADENGTYSGTLKGKNLIFCLLDPDEGIGPTFDAEVHRDNWDIFLMQKEETDRGFRLKYAKNMKGVNWSRDITGLITRIVPVAKDEGGEDMLLPGNPFVDSNRIDDYPVIRLEYLAVDGQVGQDDGSGEGTTWTQAALYQEMYDKATERFTVDGVDEVSHEITVDFEAIGATDEHPELKELQKVLMYDLVKVTDERIGLEAWLRVTEMEWDFIRQKITGLKLTNISTNRRTVTGYQVANNSITGAKLTGNTMAQVMEQVVSIMPEYSDPTASRPATVNVTDGDPTLSWGTRSTVGTVQGTNLHVTMPANPASASDNNPTLAWGTKSKVGTVAGTDLHVTMPANPAPAVEDNLNSSSTTSALSANQGKTLNEKIEPEAITSLPFRTGRFYCNSQLTIGGTSIPSYTMYDLVVYGTTGMGIAVRTTSGAMWRLYGASGSWAGAIQIT